MQRSHRQARSAQPSNVDRAAQIGRVSWASLFQRGCANASTHKVYTALALSLLLSSVVSAVHPKAGVRMLAVNTSFALGGAWLADLHRQRSHPRATARQGQNAGRD